ncbi:MAG: hypothetical protein V4498_00890 [candidate division FCPU426 bacterium]
MSLKKILGRCKKPLALGFMILAGCVSLASAFQVTLAPSREEIVLKPGASRRAKFYVTGMGNSPLQVKIKVMDLDQTPAGIAVPVTPGSTAWSAASWIKPIREKFTSFPGRPSAVGYDVEVPADAKGGGYAFIVVQCMPLSESRKKGNLAVVNSADLSYLVFVSVKGTEEYKARIIDIKPTSDQVGQPFKILCTVENQGNVMIRPQGKLDLVSGEEKHSYLANSRNMAIMPGKSRVFVIDDREGVKEAGDYKFKLDLNYGGKNSLEATGDLPFQ